MKRIFIFITVVAAIFVWSCEDELSNPRIVFQDGVDSIAEVFPGDLFYVKGEVLAEKPISGAFYFHQKKDQTGRLEETGDRLELGQDGNPNSFSLGFIVEASTVGVKIIAEDTKGNRSVKIFKVIQGVNGLEITFDEPGFIEDIESGEPFTVKGKVMSKTKITSLTYRVVKGDITENPVNIDITNDLEMTFEIALKAQNGMTGVMLNAVNKGELTTNKLFELKHVTSLGPIIIFDKEKISVKPDSLFTISGRITSDEAIANISYKIVRGGTTDAAVSTNLTDNRFDFKVNAGENVTGVMLMATDARGKESMQILPVSILFPSATVGNVMVHYQNIILTDARFPKSYFSFSLEPYVLNDVQAAANQGSVNLMYYNCFISDGNSVNGPAIFGPNVSTGGTIKANDLVEGWSTSFNLSRTPVANDLYSTVGKTFDEIGDTPEDWDAVDAFIKGKIASSSVVRQYNVSVGYIFAIGYGGTTAGEINKYAIAIVRGLGGARATSPGESTGAWIEIEIKMRK